MGIVQKDAFRTTLISYFGIILGYLNKGLLFVIILSEEQIGLINLLIVVGTLFAQFSGFGSIFTTLKFLPFFKDIDKNHFGFFPLVMRMVTWGTIITAMCFIVFRPVIEYFYEERSAAFVDYYWWVFPIGIGYVYYLLFEAYLRSFYKNILPIFTYEIVLRLAVTLSLIFYWSNHISFDTFIKINSLIYLLPPLILTIYLWRQNEFILSTKKIEISKRFRKLISQFAMYNYFNSLGAILVISLDVMMIAQMLGLGAAGIYSTVIFIASALMVPSRSIIRVSGPLVAEFWKHRKMDEMDALYKKTGAVSLFLGLSCFIVIWLNIDLFFSFLKPEFQPGIWVFFTLMIGRFFEMFFGLTGVIFSTSKKYKYDIYFTIALVGIVYGLNLVFIPAWGIVGASISTAIALMVYNIGRFIFINKAYKLNPFQKNQFIVLCLAIATLLICEFVGGFAPNLWIRAAIVLPLSFLLFIVPVFYFKLEPQTLQYVKNGWQFIRKRIKKS